MKQGFLLSGKTHKKEKSENSRDEHQSLGPLHDARIVRPIYGWDVISRHGHNRSSDLRENAEGSMISDELYMFDRVKIHSAESLDHAKSECNPYQGIPNLPFKTYSVPMNALDCYYGKNFKRYQVKMSENYFSWNDQNPKSHLLRWTAIFLCPISGEIFITGSWPLNDPLRAVSSPAGKGNHLSGHEENSQVIEDCTGLAKDGSSITNCELLQCRWMKTLKDAKHGAAAWAYDCFQYRNKYLVENSESKASKGAPLVQVAITGPIGSEIPYLQQKGIFTAPEFVPQATKDRIEHRQKEIRLDALKYDKLDMEINEELAWHSSKNHPPERVKEGI